MLSEGEGNIVNQSQEKMTRTQQFDFVIGPEDSVSNIKNKDSPLEDAQPLKWIKHVISV